MPKYTILIGSIDMDDQSLATHDDQGKNIKYMKGDLLTAFKEAKEDGHTTLEDVMSWQREQLEAGKDVAMKFVKIG